MKIKTFNLTIPANRSSIAEGYEAEATIVIPIALIDKIKPLVLAKITEKFPNIINPVLCQIHLSRRSNESTLNANCEVNIGDGDYVFRDIQIELPLLNWLTKEGE